MKILFIAPLPPPINGQSLASKVFYDAVSKDNQVTIVDMAKQKKTGLMATISRSFGVFAILILVARHAREADRIYLTISQSTWGNLKDLLIYCLCLGRLDRMFIHLHGGASMIKIMRGRLSAPLNGIFLRRIGGAIILGESHRPIFERVLPPERIHVVANFAEDELFIDAGLVPEKFRNGDKVRFLYLSNFLPGKGFNELLDAFESLPEDLKSKARIDFAGAFNTDAQRSRFLKRIKGLENLRYHGIVQGEAKVRLFQASHVFCLPTYYRNEGQPVSILEAYAAGCAVLTTDHSGIKDVFTDGVNGYQVEIKSPASIRKAMLRILERPSDLVPIGVENRRSADRYFRTSIYNESLKRIIGVPLSHGNPKIMIQKKAAPVHYAKRIQYQVCKNCVMDTTDSQISFDSQGVCDHCNNFYKSTLPNWDTGEAGRKALQKTVDQIKREGVGKPFDCIIGMSGGLDSSYLTHVAVKDLGLRPLVFHVDGGWNSQIAVNNIEVIVDKLKLDLYTEVIDWEEMKDFQLAFFKAGVSNIDIPQDHAFVSTMYHFAYKHKIRCILNGGNISTECVRNPLEWIYYGTDMAQIRDIHRQFGTRPLEKYPFSNILWHKVYLRYIKRIEVVKPLNNVPFIRKEAIKLLEDEYGWQAYPQKHFESRFTKFYEGYWLPTKFGYDTRKVQFSSLILTKQMTREEALERLSKPAYDEATIAQDFEYIATKLGITVDELRGYLSAPNKTHRDYKSNEKMFLLGSKALKLMGVEKAVKR